MALHDEEMVVLLDERCRPMGSMPKNVVHTNQTPFHLALSCYLFDEQGRLLITQRALAKKTWPGVVTNSACGHPGVNESLQDAARRVVGHELGCEITGLTTVLPGFSYRAVSSDGLVEWEYCPVVTATVCKEDVVLNRDEVEGALWMEWQSFLALVDSKAVELSPWCRLQAGALKDVGVPINWPDCSDRLPAFLQ